MPGPGDRLTTAGTAGAAFAGEGLSCRRGERLVFARLDFALSPGGLLLLRGPNGSGKSSLLRLMAGLLRPIEGRLVWDGAALDAEGHRRRIAFLGHLDALKPALTTSENLAFWCGEAAVPAALAAYGIEHLARRPARFLSLGQRRRLALARIVASPATLWLLDEPANGLDDEAHGMFRSALAQHRLSGGMAAIALHGESDLPDAATLDLGRFAA